MRINTTSENTPLVSICIPTHNGEKYLKEALESVKKQSYKNLEVIFSDDNSRDQTMNIILDFKNTFPGPVQIHQHTPASIGANWNNCIKKANGKYIKFLFQDDVLFPDCIEKMIVLAEKDEQIGLVYCRRDFLFEKNENSDWLKNHSELHKHWNNINIVNNEIIQGKLLLKDKNILKFPQNKIGEPTAVLLRKTCFDKLGYFNERLNQALDIEYWMRIMKKYKIGFIEKQLVYFRIHKNQATQLNQKNGINEKDLLEKFCYEKLFWNFNSKVRWTLFKKMNKSKKLFKFYHLIKGNI